MHFAGPFYLERHLLSSTDQHNEEVVLDKIFTVPNVISFARLCLVPIFLYLLVSGQNLAATVLYALAACTDWVDGQIARRTHQVSKLGQLLDPAVDRILMIAGVFGLLAVGSLPLWIVLLVVIRDVLLLIGGYVLLHEYHTRVAVIYAGKVATTFLFVGCAGLLLNMPLIAGLGWCDLSWLPGFNSAVVSWGIWFVYAGLALGIVTTAIYIARGIHAARTAKPVRSVVN